MENDTWLDTEEVLNIQHEIRGYTDLTSIPKILH